MQKVSQTWSTLFLSRELRRRGIRKIDREINEMNKLFKEYTKNIIEEIVKEIKANPEGKSSEGLIAKLIRSGKLV